MKKLTSILLILLGLCSFAIAQQSDKWLSHYKKEIEIIGDEPTIDQLAMLARLAGNNPDSENKVIIRELALQKLQTIPDFPNQIRDHILKKKEEFQSGKISLDDYHLARQHFGPLGRVPDPRVVGMLGEFLHDEDWPAGKSLDAELHRLVPNSLLAIRMLGNLLEKPPVQGDPESYKEDEIETWRLWYEQVKAGNRTFRFKGDPQEYSLAGPVSEARDPKGTRPAEVAKVVAESPARAEKKSTGLPVWPLTFAGVLLAVAIWFASKRRSAAA